MIQITGSITARTYQGADFTVARFLDNASGQNVIVAGNLEGYQESEALVLYGEWTEWENKRTKQKVNQFKVEAAFRPRPLSLKALEAYLADAIPGCGPLRARLLIKKHGEKLFDYLDKANLNELIQVRGIGESTAERIIRGWRENSLDLYIGQFLSSIGISVKWAKNIRRDLGPNAVQIIQNNPYRLISVAGIAFKKADEIASRLGWTSDSPERAEAVLNYLLEESGNSGHSFLPRALLVEQATKECFVGGELIGKVLEAAYQKKTLIKEVANTKAGPVELVYLPRLYNAEVKLARKLRLLLQQRPFCRYTPQQLGWMIQDRERALEVELTAEQREAILKAFTEPISILTGGPGTGKTMCQRVLVEVARLIGYSMSLCAPTGRAAKHLSNITGEPALTIHRLLKYDPDLGRWAKNSEDPLDTGIVIADEFSMVDIDLGYRIFDAVRPGVPVLIIGDKDQLPAVSPGRVLEDLIVSKAIPVTRLTKIFRQAEKSLIVQNAHRILRGESPQFPAKAEGAELVDAYLLEPPEIPSVDEKGKPVRDPKTKKQKQVEDPEWIKSRILAMCRTRIPRRFLLDPIRDVQVLTPMKKGPCGVHDLNTTLQDALNPKPEGAAGEGTGPSEISLGTVRFRTGDRVLITKNNYKLKVSNGDIGFILKIDDEEQMIHCDFDGDIVQVPYEDAKQDMQLGYCLSVHKAQGGEFPVVIVVLLRRNHVMLQRNLLYTAVTRAKQLLVFMANKWVIEKAAANGSIQQRNSFLAIRMRRELEQKADAVA